MELSLTPREGRKKSQTKHIRREGDIPATIYSKGEKGIEVVVDGKIFNMFLEKLEKNTLSSHVFTLNLEGKTVSALLKEIQYHRTTYNVIHLDFMELHDDVPINFKVPIKSIGAEMSPAIRQGGILRQVHRSIEVRCLPAHIPSHFELDVSHLEFVGQGMKISDLSIPEGVELRATYTNEVAVLIAKK